MAQVWKCVKCGESTTSPRTAGDHERKHNGELVWTRWDQFGNLRHYMEDLGE